MRNKIFFIILLTLLFNSCTMYKIVDIGSVNDVDFKGLKSNNINLDISLPINNPNLYPIKIKSVDLDLYVNDKLFGKIKNNNDIKFAAKCNETYLLPIDVEIKNVLSGALQMINLSNSEKIKIRIKGNVKARGLIFVKKIEVDENSVIDL